MTCNLYFILIDSQFLMSPGLSCCDRVRKRSFKNLSLSLEDWFYWAPVQIKRLCFKKPVPLALSLAGPMTADGTAALWAQMRLPRALIVGPSRSGTLP